MSYEGAIIAGIIVGGIIGSYFGIVGMVVGVILCVMFFVTIEEEWKKEKTNRILKSEVP